MPSFPWRQTHVWFADDRCVLTSHDASNFAMVDRELLSRVDIPVTHVHPMPVDVTPNSTLCTEDGAQLYANWLSAYAPDARLDFLLLGVGTDTHTASLFPNQPTLDSVKQAEVTSAPVSSRKQPTESQPLRMTLTLQSINRSRCVVLFVTGFNKNKALKKLAECNDFHE